MRRQVWNLKRDTAEKAIVEALEALGAHVTRISGRGAPDLLVRHRGQLHALEVKSGKGKRTDAQEQSQWPIVRSVEEALQAIGAVGGFAALRGSLPDEPGTEGDVDAALREIR